MDTAGKQVGLAAPQLAGARTGEQEAIRVARAVEHHLDRVQQTRQALHLVDEDRLAPPVGRQRGKPFLQLVRVARELEVGRRMKQVDGQVWGQLRDECRLPGLTRAEEEDALGRLLQPGEEPAVNHVGILPCNMPTCQPITRLA